MDRLWFGYWIGGASMAVAVAIPYYLSPGRLMLPVVVAGWVLLTPVGIWVARRMNERRAP